MEKEYIFTGYCRCLDAARIVEVIQEEGALTGIDCQYENCPHKAACQIGKQISELE